MAFYLGSTAVGGSYSTGSIVMNTGTFTPTETTQVYSFDVGIDASQYNHLVVARLDTDFTGTSWTATQLVGVYLADFTLGLFTQSRSTSTSNPFSNGYAGATSTGYTKVERSGSTITFNGYSYAAKFEAGVTYRWFVWNEV